MGESFQISVEHTEFLKKMKSRLGYTPDDILPVAFAVGLHFAENIPQARYDSGGHTAHLPVIQRGQKYRFLFNELIKFKFNEEDDFHEREVYKQLTEYGISILKDKYEEAEDPEFLAELASNIEELPITPNVKPKLINIKIGVKQSDKTPIVIHWNNTKRNQHTAIIGMSGAGKTQLSLSILAQIERDSQETGFLIFDYAKGDIAESKLADKIGAEVVNIAERRLPYNPFSMPRNVRPELFIESIVDVFSTVFSKIGTVQRQNLRDFLIRGYQNSNVDVYSLSDMITQTYQHRDTVTEVFTNLVNFNLFPNYSESIPFEDILHKKIIINLRDIPSDEIKRFFAFIVLNRYYRTVMSLSDAIEENDNRQMRGAVFIDEAHQFLKYPNNPIARLIRESRSKGISLLLASQQIEDFDTDEDYLDNISWVFLMKTKVDKPRVFRKVLDVSDEQLKTLVSNISSLSTGDLMTKIDGDVVTADAELFYKLHGS